MALHFFSADQSFSMVAVASAQGLMNTVTLVSFGLVGLENVMVTLSVARAVPAMAVSMTAEKAKSRRIDEPGRACHGCLLAVAAQDVRLACKRRGFRVVAREQSGWRPAPLIAHGSRAMGAVQHIPDIMTPCLPPRSSCI